MLDAHYSPRAQRVPVSQTTATVAAGSRRLRLGDTCEQDSDALVDLSSRGMRVLTRSTAPEVGGLFDIELRHPEVRGALVLTGRVKWVTEGPESTHSVGFHFEQVRDTTAVALERLIAIEIGDPPSKD